ncbi:MAG: ArnT family glycosyltransferase [Phycisphaerae bacterium]
MKCTHHLLAPLVIGVVGVALYLPGITWGVPGTVSWSQDTIAGVRTLGAVAEWPAQWKGRYAPLHYLILDAAYMPVIEYWNATGQRTVDPSTNKATLKPPHPPKIGLLIMIARVVTVCMAVATALGLWFAARLLTSDDLAAGLAAAALMISAVFTYFAHLGNVDVPAMCWFAWSVFFYVRLLQGRRLRDAAVLGLFASLAIGTKDATAGVYPGMAVVLLAAETGRYAREMSWWRALLRAVFQVRWFIGLALCAVPYLLLYNAFAHPDRYVERIRYWLDPPPGTLHAAQHRYENQLQLMWAAVRYTAGGIGWPMLFAMGASIAYFVRCHRANAFVIIVPAVSYYLAVVVPIDFVYSRFLLPPLALLYIAVGFSGAALIRSQRLSAWARVGLCCLVLVPSIAYAAAIDLEMINDSRYDAEEWFRENVPPASNVGAFSPGQYLPRLHELEYHTYSLEMTRHTFTKPQPQWLVLTSYNYEDFNADQRVCMDALLRGRLGYRRMAAFNPQYLGTGTSWLGVAGWGAPTPGKASPSIIVMARTRPS